jgi:hypothetical protein
MSQSHVHVMPEYGDTFPVWERTPGREVGPIDPVRYGLPWDLILDLQAWNREWPENGDSEEWRRYGQELVTRLQQELGQDVRVTYKY